MSILLKRGRCLMTISRIALDHQLHMSNYEKESTIMDKVTDEEGVRITVFEEGFQREYLVTSSGKRFLLGQKLIFWLKVAEESKKHDEEHVTDQQPDHSELLRSQLATTLPRL